MGVCLQQYNASTLKVIYGNDNSKAIVSNPVGTSCVECTGSTPAYFDITISTTHSDHCEDSAPANRSEKVPTYSGVDGTYRIYQVWADDEGQGWCNWDTTYTGIVDVQHEIYTDSDDCSTTPNLTYYFTDLRVHLFWATKWYLDINVIDAIAPTKEITLFRDRYDKVDVTSGCIGRSDSTMTSKSFFITAASYTIVDPTG